MAQYFVLHPQNPQPRLIAQAVEILRNGGVVAYPTDSSYALGCVVGNKDAQDRIRAIRGVDDDHLFTLVCRNLSELAVYAQVDNSQFRLLKANTPGQYTFILKATREVPRRLQHPKRSTLGLRVPDHAVTQALLEALDEPLLSMSLQLPGEEDVLNEAWEIRDRLEHQLDLVIDAGACSATPTTVIDLTGDSPILVRAGAGSLAPFGLTE
ncbi:L-threonylcarbamoyladenylate synthase [Methylovorus glucosotrophus]|jgi:tRNA threonylcarbamoyl adenosine modification protein (Sua5/YciO/YrdC/YwlC family)|uniref:Sua5/YciO/YrdC/YwlC family protein n=1 Tax=Methylovorus glucosotrophus (strain SIP3-4) TaxID=582744 RepID=C6XC92_METGS|nr:L-threonylcarbamoyladenylate synthase [Methylovorus glucosotrophus]ACT50167.1 Sua5/YciO/YrdC/YwlC family protein [Methylovorus glucosotrophus SIP3-4]KAF0844495.1 tRNA threonylcarbamoyl adenosine modification protein (Sua5/YciO/YrdC/YwlC family) [Methylovorus glucosotrophus]